MAIKVSDAEDLALLGFSLNNVLVAKVHKNADARETGIIKVLTGEEISQPLDVYYTSPYAGRASHGMVAGIPEEGDEILIIKPNNSENWFYLGSLWQSQEYAHLYDTEIPTEGPATNNPDEPRAKGKTFPDDKMYKHRGIPMRYFWKSPLGHKITLSDSQNNEERATYLQLASGKGKTITLDDSPGVDAIIMGNEHGGHIKVSTDGIVGKGQGSESIQVECKGSILLQSNEDDITIKVLDGKDINIINMSNGTKKDPNFPEVDNGSINIHSQYQNINLSVAAPDGEINIRAAGDTGVINVIAEGDNSNLNLRSENTLSLSSKNKLNISSDSDDIDITSGGIVNIN